MNYEQYLPRFNSHGNVYEEPKLYAQRIREALPNWPIEILIEWPFQYPYEIADYGFLDFRHMKFEKVTWALEDIPGVEVYDDPRTFFDYQTIDEDAKDENNWLPIYMKEHGTWKQPIILFSGFAEINIPDGYGPFISPLHLIEGRRRLSYLNVLRDQGKAESQHEIWLVTLEQQTDR